MITKYGRELEGHLMNWIRTKYAQPEDADNVLIAERDGYGKKCYDISMGYFMPDENEWYNWNDCKIQPPSHWMEIEQPVWDSELA